MVQSNLINKAHELTEKLKHLSACRDKLIGDDAHINITTHIVRSSIGSPVPDVLCLPPELNQSVKDSVENEIQKIWDELNKIVTMENDSEN